MKRKLLQFATALILLACLINNSTTFYSVLLGHAQSVQTWSSPVNLSNSGSSTDPTIIVDQEGMLHVIWKDALDGYKYTESKDGVKWTSPIIVKFPFSPKNDSDPVFVVNPKGAIHVFWTDIENTLYYSQTQASDLANPSKWSGASKIAASVLDFNTTVDDTGSLYLSYATAATTDAGPAGIYYRRFASNWLAPIDIYASQYFRSMVVGNAHVRIAISDPTGQGSMYIVWDDRAQKRIYLTKSSDQGATWNTPLQLQGPENSSGVSIPFNVNVMADTQNVLVLWQMGQPGSRCTQYSQVSSDGGDNFQDPVRILNEYTFCPQETEFVTQKSDFSIVNLMTQEDFSLIAWNGSSWSDLQSQDQLSSFTNPVTFDNVIFGCQKLSSYNGILYAVGCDQGNGGDIWFSSRPLSSLSEWFPSLSSWSSPSSLSSAVGQNIPTILSVADASGSIHSVWFQNSTVNDSEGEAVIQYARWDGKNWIKPTAIIAGLSGSSAQLSFGYDPTGRLLLAWVDEKTGELFFSWAGFERANRSSEWTNPSPIQTISQSASSPALLVDSSGKIVIAYAVSINEQRGIYFVETDDAGKTWSKPIQVFDATSAGWDLVDQPQIVLTGDGKLHAMFGRYSLFGTQRHSLGLYYSQSADGGLTWSEPELVSNQPVYWSKIVGYDTSTEHRLWQERQQGAFVIIHQVSKDGGITWSKPSIVSSTSGDYDIASLVVDPDESLHLLQLVFDSGWAINDQKWDGSHWVSQETKYLSLKSNTMPYMLDAGVTSKGNLLVNVLTRAEENNAVKIDIVYLNKLLDLSESIANPSPALLATAFPGATPNLTNVPDSAQTPTPASPLTGLTDNNESLAKSKNLVGIGFIVIIVVLIVVFMRPGSKGASSGK